MGMFPYAPVIKFSLDHAHKTIIKVFVLWRMGHLACIDNEMAYFTRSVAKPSGYYVALNSRCSADMYGHQNGTAVSLRCDDEDVDRIVAQRHTVSSHTLCFYR